MKPEQKLYQCNHREDGITAEELRQMLSMIFETAEGMRFFAATTIAGGSVCNTEAGMLRIMEACSDKIMDAVNGIFPDVRSHDE